MLKTYKSNQGKLYVLVYIKGKPRRIIFETNGQNFAEAFYTTKDKEEQNALDKLSSFGKKFVLYKSYDNKAEEPDTDLTQVDVLNWQEASGYLQEKYSIDGRKLRSPNKIRMEGKNVGIAFSVKNSSND